jgi:serine/threonine-protein kinase
VLLALLVVGLIAAAAFLWPRLFESAPDQVQVPDTVGMKEAKARDVIGDAGLTIGPIETRPDQNVKAGLVIEQDPSAADFVDPDTEVTLVISEGKPEVAVPPVVGEQRGDAANALRNAGFQVAFEEEQSDEDRGQVLRTDPEVGVLAPAGSMVTVFWSDGKEKVPGVVGRQQGEAERLIQDAGFTPVVVESDNTTEPAGTVIQQVPEAGSELAEGQQVTIVVSTYVEPTETPDPSDEPTGEPTDPESTDIPPIGQRRGSA